MKQVNIHYYNPHTGNIEYKTKDIDCWLLGILNDGHLEEKTKTTAVAVADLITVLVNKGLLTVEEVVEVLHVNNVTDADQPTEDDRG